MLSSLAIDPDFPIGTQLKPSGMIYPVGYSKFSGANIDAYPKFIITTPKNEYIYVYLSNGKFVRYNSDLTGETLIGTVLNSSGNGAFYYNNYIYLISNDNIARYGPLDGTPSLTQNWWTGLSLPALNNVNYPAIKGVRISNHFGIAHVDDFAYFIDYVNGGGVLHAIKTRKTTYEGDTNNGSAYNVIDFPFGFYPTSISQYGLDIAIVGIQTTSSNINQGFAKLILWNPNNPITFYRIVNLPDPIATHCFYQNGSLYIVSGNAQKGFRLLKYLGGEVVKEELFHPDGTPPLQGAVDYLGSRLVFGSFISEIANKNYGSVYAYGLKEAGFSDGLFNVARTSQLGANVLITSLKYYTQDNFVKPTMIIGWGDGTNFGLDKYSATATLDSVYRTKVFSIGKKFKINKIIIPLGEALTTNHSCTPKIYIDNDFDNPIKTLKEINTINFSAGNYKIVYSNLDIQVEGKYNFVLELNFGGTRPLPINFPIEIELLITDE